MRWGAEGGRGGDDRRSHRHCCHWWWLLASTLLYSSGTYLLGGMDDVSSMCDVVIYCHHCGRQQGGTGLREFLKCRFVITALRQFSKSRPRTFGTTNVHYRKRKEEQHHVPLSLCGGAVVIVDNGHDR